MGFFDNLSNLNFTGDGGILEKVIPGLIVGGLGTVASSYGPKPQQDYASTQAGFEANQALAREKLAQDLLIAKMNAGSAGAGAGAAIAAARIAAKVNLAALREKAMADALSARFSQNQLQAQSIGQAADRRVNTAQGVGQAGLSGYGNMANVLSGFRA